ncbi:hypothetical protein AWW66_12175 [Micromonospora rosaria]|uniref:Uncharacterized protein n=1 Tax=Micromonospora rosaria TaxID=47874 RepID=A0A136PTK9_9ACTN|nr:hypothetical protein [Micromonospora rosaria]KXK61752.1 hypothetical protein AWW66_12175 [Micromonospora rosaria]
MTSARPRGRAALRALRDLTRLAVTLLVLAIGLSGVTAALAGAPSAATATAAPSVSTGRVAELRSDTSTVVREAESAPQPSAPAGDTVSAPPAAVRAPSTVTAAAPPPGVPGRRGPPSA